METLTENSLTPENCCKTEVNVVKCSYRWSITSFSTRPEGIGEYLTSSTFSASHYDKYKWCLHFYPNGLYAKPQVGYEDYVSLGLELVSHSNAIINVKFSLLNDKNEITHWEQQTGCRFSHGFLLGLGYFIQRSVILNQANGLLPDDTLTIICDIEMMLDAVNTSSKGNVLKKPDCERITIRDLDHLFDNMNFTDVTIIVGDSEIKVHKNILAASSVVFDAMFKHDMEESRLNRVTITDISYEAVQEMLRFIYTGKISNFDNTATELLMAAEKYALMDLKKLCEMELCGKLSVEGAFDMLILAYHHGADYLKEQALEFISNNIDVLETKCWQRIDDSQEYFVNDAIIALTRWSL